MYQITMVGNVQGDPVSAADTTPILAQSIDLAFRATYDAVWGGGGPIDASNGSPYIVQLGAATKVRALALRPLDGQSLVVKVTSGAGTDQAIPVSDLLVIRANNAGDELTAIKVVGVGRIEYLLAANKT